MVVDGGRARAWGMWTAWPFLRTPLPNQAWISSTVVAAVVLPFLLGRLGHARPDAPVVTGVMVVGLSVLNVEIGRLLEGGVTDRQRPHKALSAWTFASALLLPTWWLLPVAVVTYAHARWRGMRVTSWKWVGSAAYVVLAGLVAALTARAIVGDGQDLMHGDGLVGLVAVVTAAAAFLATETVLFHGSAYLNDPADEVWLRSTLASWSFYLTEAAVLLVGGLSAAIWSAAGWFIVLLAPVWLMTQRAALHEPLRQRAEHDDKTGALRFESWRRLVSAGVERCRRRGQPWCVIFADLDRFREFNEAWGHLVGDEALGVVTNAIRAELRDDDLLGRFGGEEFCAFLPDVGLEDASGVAERIRSGVSSASVPGADPVTISIGVAVVPADAKAVEFVSVLTNADRALYRAKNDGRNRSYVVALSGQDARPSPS